jgi:acyl-CoA reductase-like NAD-dependent aldehyde dehydrogenase
VRIANDSEYALGGFVDSEDVDRATAIARRLETGSVGVNENPMPVNAPLVVARTVVLAAKWAGERRYSSPYKVDLSRGPLGETT